MDANSISSLPGRKKAHVVLPRPGGDALGVAAGEIEYVDLIEGVARLAFALKHEALSVRRPVSFARALAFDRESAHAREKSRSWYDGAGAVDWEASGATSRLATINVRIRVMRHLLEEETNGSHYRWTRLVAPAVYVLCLL